MIVSEKKYSKENLIYSDTMTANGHTWLNNMLQVNPQSMEKSLGLAKKKNRLIVQKGIEYFSIILDDIALFYTKNKIVFAVDRLGQKYVADETLTLLERHLDSDIFFRANRQFIVSVNFIKSFVTYERVKLKVNMNPDELNDRHFIIVSQVTAPKFRKWMYTA